MKILHSRFNFHLSDLLSANFKIFVTNLREIFRLKENPEKYFFGAKENSGNFFPNDPDRQEDRYKSQYHR